jgi:hypothetical protein
MGGLISPSLEVMYIRTYYIRTHFKSTPIHVKNEMLAVGFLTFLEDSLDLLTLSHNVKFFLSNKFSKIFKARRLISMLISLSVFVLHFLLVIF